MKKLKFTLAGRHFVVSLTALIGYILLMAVLCSLGSWQLRRAEEKEQYLQHQRKALQAPKIDLNRMSQPDLVALEYKPVTVYGYYDVSRQFLIDNQIKNGKAGYFVMTPLFVARQDYAVLVNRGWLPTLPDRTTLPNVAIAIPEPRIGGRINHFPSVGLKLKGADIPSESWPSVVQVVDVEILEKKLGYRLANFQIELDPQQPDGYLRDWRSPVIMSPEKHIAYAVQWFGLAITLTVLVIWFSYKKNG